MHAAAVADGRIYVAGGFDGIRDLSAAEIYDPRLGCRAAFRNLGHGGVRARVEVSLRVACGALGLPCIQPADM